MYAIKIDGQVLYSPATSMEAYTVLAPKLALGVNDNGTLSFVLPPRNRLYNAIRRMKSIVTVLQDGEEIFHGRVTDDENSMYKEKTIYCEGVRAYLNDSLAAPYTYTGTPRGLFEKLIAEHNEQVEPEKRFTIGRVTVKKADEAISNLKNVAYWATYKEIEEKLLSAYGGYLKVRNEGGVLYIDWLEEYGCSNPQKIRFSINLLDLKDKNTTGEVFTILRPLGESIVGEDGEYGEALTVASVNGGLNYIQDEEAVAKYGKIWHAHTWHGESDPSKLLEKGREYLKTGAELKTLTLRAIDMHFIDGNAQAIWIGDKVHILSHPHGLDVEMVCSKIDIDIADPENTMYTFGEPPKLLTENLVAAEEEIGGLTGGYGGGGGRSVKEESDGILRWAKIKIDEANANINLHAGEINSLTGRMNQAEIDIDGLNANILLKASQKEVTDLGMRLSQAEIEIDGANAQILLKASQKEVDDLGERVTAAEIEISGVDSRITLLAQDIELKGYVTAEMLKTDAIIMRTLNVTSATTTDSLNVNNDVSILGDLKVREHKLSMDSVTVLTDDTTLGVDSSGGTVTGVKLNKKTKILYYMSWA